MISSYVHTQPNGPQETHQAILALVDCPVDAIGSHNEITSKVTNDLFPIPITKHSSGDVYYCGWSAKKSFGANSWLIRRSEGNVLIDSPRWNNSLAKQIQKMGGISQMILTHKDDVADHKNWVKEFKCKRWIHKSHADAAPEAERLLEGVDSLFIGKNLKLIPTPGHTAGSMVALLGDQKQILFSGNHLWWNPSKK